MFISERIKTLREKQGLNQARLAELAGLPQSAVARIEVGDMANLTLKTLRKFAKAFQVELSELLTGVTDVAEGGIYGAAEKRRT